MSNPFYASAEAWIKAEWSVGRAFIALHPYWAMLGGLSAGFIFGHIL